MSKLRSLSQNKDDEDDGGLHARFSLNNNNAPQSTVYMVDEASLISDIYSENETFLFGSGHLLQDLLEYVRGRKIVFVGDYAQLPPVGMNFSPALDAEYVRRTYHCDVAEIKLTEVVRQGARSGILHNATKIRNSIEAKTFIEFKLDAADDFRSEEADLLRPYFRLSADKPAVKAAVIAYSNKQVLQYNRLIRRHYFGEEAPRLLPGELLMIARNCYAFDAELFNGNIVLVTSCEADADVERRTVRVKMGKDRVETVELCFRKVSIKFHTGSGVVELHVMILDNFLEEPTPTVGGLLARALIVDFHQRLPAAMQEQLPAIRRLLRAQEKLDWAQQEWYDAYLERLSRDPYYNALICKYGYALTCHKAQGGEWDTVFVDMCRFGGTANEDYFRWAYTAFTRASQQLWHYHSPDFDYISRLIVEQTQASANIRVSTFTPEGEDFRAYRYRRIQALAQQRGLSVTEDTSRAYQHGVTFTDGSGGLASFVLWYKAKGYSSHIDLRQSNSDALAQQGADLLSQSILPDDIPFSTPQRPFAQQLHRHLLALFDEIGIQLLDITQEPYHDCYHLKTGGWAKVEMWYNAKGCYTYMRPISSLGDDDEKLEALRRKFL